MMEPVRTADANVVYKAPKSMPECGDLWVRRLRPGVVRCTWEPTDGERKLIAEGGRIQLTLAHEPIPPIIVEVMSKDVTEPVGPHGFRIDKHKEDDSQDGTEQQHETTDHFDSKLSPQEEGGRAPLGQASEADAA